MGLVRWIERNSTIIDAGCMTESAFVNRCGCAGMVVDDFSIWIVVPDSFCRGFSFGEVHVLSEPAVGDREQIPAGLLRVAGCVSASVSLGHGTDNTKPRKPF